MVSFLPDLSQARVIAVGLMLSVGLGLAAGFHAGVLIALLTFLPVVSHVRWVGLRRALVEPSAVTMVLFFYLCVFPQRGLSIAFGESTYIDFAFGQITDNDLLKILLIASFGTAAFIEAFHFVRTRKVAGGQRVDPDALDRLRPRTVYLATIVGGTALLSLAMIVVENNGFAAAADMFTSHLKSTGAEAQSFAGSIWATLAVPAIWCASYVVLDRGTARALRTAFALVVIAIIVAQLAIFGSRLDALLGLMGAWVIAHYTGRRIPVIAVLAALPLLVLISVPVLNERAAGRESGLSATQKYSEIVSYGVLDATLAVHQQPRYIRAQMTDPSRWSHLPAYLVPGPLWPGRPNIEADRMDVFVVQNYGRPNQRDSGAPTSYLTEAWLYGGVGGVLVISVLFGAAVGALHRRLLNGPRASMPASNLLWYCVVVSASFSYYKDGDILMSVVGSWRLAIYLGVLMVLTGVWSPSGLSRRGWRPTLQPS